MSFYRSFLEEGLDTPILDDNNSPEIKEIEDIVNDQDANAEEQDDAQAAEFGPDEGVEDILDETYIAIAEAENEFNKIGMAIGIHELNETVSGREVVYEAVDIKQYFVKAKNWVVSFFKKVWSVLKRYAANLASVFKTNKGFAEKYANQIKDGYKLFKNSKNELQGYEYPAAAFNAMLADNKWKTSNTSKAVKEIKGYITKIASWRDDDKSSIAFSSDDSESILANYRKFMAGKECSQSELANAILLKLRGGSEKKKMYMEPDYVIEVLKFNGMKDINSTIKASKNEYKEAISNLNSIEKSLKNEDKTSSEKLGSVYRLTDCFKSILSITQISRNAMLKAVHGRSIQARLYGQAYVAAKNKDTHRGFQKESSEYGFLSNLNLV